ncbi:MAG TPA: cytotoxic translational repressor of toxin-antitoxin stability system [Syntrophaceae bacterium]|jgi:mRNA interferase RelE/StbE|nr:cytotoxic translational repressor of toxin-antitoxin stability system [Syntrophaceae bacterium]
MYEIDWKNKAAKQLAKIGDKDTRDEIFNTAETLCYYPDVRHIKKLTKHKYPYRLKVGRYRVFFEVSNTVKIIHIEEVKKRDDRTY